MVESQKTENVDIDKFLSDVEACAGDVQELIAMETDSIRKVDLYSTQPLCRTLSSIHPLSMSPHTQAALEQLSLTLAHHREVLLAKKRQLETSNYKPPVGLAQQTSGDVVSQTSTEGEDSLVKR